MKITYIAIGLFCVCALAFAQGRLRIPDAPPASSIDGQELFPIDKNSTNRHAKIQQILDAGLDGIFGTATVDLVTTTDLTIGGVALDEVALASVTTGGDADTPTVLHGHSITDASIAAIDTLLDTFVGMRVAYTDRGPVSWASNSTVVSATFESPADFIVLVNLDGFVVRDGHTMLTKTTNLSGDIIGFTLERSASDTALANRDQPVEWLYASDTGAAGAGSGQSGTLQPNTYGAKSSGTWVSGSTVVQVTVDNYPSEIAYDIWGVEVNGQGFPENKINYIMDATYPSYFIGVELTRDDDVQADVTRDAHVQFAYLTTAPPTATPTVTPTPTPSVDPDAVLWGDGEPVEWGDGEEVLWK